MKRAILEFEDRWNLPLFSEDNIVKPQRCDEDVNVSYCYPSSRLLKAPPTDEMFPLDTPTLSSPPPRSD
jgi:hypothetical protein